MQLDIMATNLPEEASGTSLKSVLAYLTSFSNEQKSLLSEISTLASLILVMPVTNAFGVGNEFVRGSEHQQTLFSTFLAADSEPN